MELLTQIFEVCLIPLLGVLTTYLVIWIRAKSKELQDRVDSDIADKYIQMLDKTITSCVIATNQTYVQSLKEQGKFDAAAQKEAFRQTSEAVMAILTDESKVYLQEAFGDLNVYITKQIEAEVKLNK